MSVAARDEFDHPPPAAFGGQIWWDCKVCGKWRPDHRISVRRRLSRFQYPDPYDAQRMGTLFENVRHCNDKPGCRRLQPLRHGAGVTRADLRAADIFGGAALVDDWHIRRMARRARPATRVVTTDTVGGIVG